LLARLGGGLLIATLALVFAWPGPDGQQTRFELGAAEDYGIGSVTLVEDGAFHLVRLSDDTIVALSWTDPGSGCSVPWRPHFEHQGVTGWFRDPCSGAIYSRDGERVLGPSPRGLASTRSPS
jgi:Rieske Fe-S protein